MNFIKSLLLINFLFFTTSAYAQTKFSSYQSNYAKKNYDIQISVDEKDSEKYSLYIDALSMDGIVDNGGFNISNKNINGFLDNLNSAQKKYDEWVQTAKANNVTSLSKKVKVESQTISSYFYYGGDWNFDFYVTPTYEFKILESDGLIKYLLIIRTGEIESSSNEYRDADGFVLVFSSSNEITEFKNLISTDKVEAFKKQPKKEDLFKD